jgi:hypothetical protein
MQFLSFGQCSMTLASDTSGMTKNGIGPKFEGNLEDRDCSISYWRAGRNMAVAIINRNLEGLIAQLYFEQLRSH